MMKKLLHVIVPGLLLVSLGSCAAAPGTGGGASSAKVDACKKVIQCAIDDASVDAATKTQLKLQLDMVEKQLATGTGTAAAEGLCETAQNTAKASAPKCAAK